MVVCSMRSWRRRYLVCWRCRSIWSLRSRRIGWWLSMRARILISTLGISSSRRLTASQSGITPTPHGRYRKTSPTPRWSPNHPATTNTSSPWRPTPSPSRPSRTLVTHLKPTTPYPPNLYKKTPTNNRSFSSISTSRTGSNKQNGWLLTNNVRSVHAVRISIRII